MQEYLEADVPEQGIALSATRASTYVGCQYAFAQTGADNPQWETSDTDIATVSQHGVLTAKKAGDVILTVREGNKFASAIVAVLDGVYTGISRPYMTVQRGATVTLTATAEVNWYSSNNGVATVSGGVVKGVAPGYAIISAYNDFGASTCPVRVIEAKQPVTQATRPETQPTQATRPTQPETQATKPTSPAATLKLNAYRASTYVGCQYALGVYGASRPAWTSSDKSVVTVDGNGVVTARGAGSAVITVSENGATAQCAFTVMNGSGTGISASSMSLINATSGRLTAATSGVRWFSSNSSVASVNNGIVTAKSAGYATISAYTANGASTCLINVTTGAQTATARLCAFQVSTYVGCQYAFWATGADNIAWTTSNPLVATIDTSGVLTARTAGAVTLNADVNGSVSTCRVQVFPGISTGISKSGMTLEKGKTATLTAAVSGVHWYSSNKNVATVSNGVVTGRAVGYATISAYTSEGASTCLVKVTEPAVTKPVEPVTPVTETKGVTEASLNVCSGPGTTYSIVTTVPSGSGFTLISNTVYNSNWYHVKMDSGVSGYVHKDYIRLITAPVITLNTRTASTFVGCQYALAQTGASKPVWKSSDTSVVTVDQNGVVTAKNAGTATVTASENGGSGSCVFAVRSGTSTGISPATLTLALGKTSKLTAKTSGVGWFSSNNKVATVNKGTVTAKGIGYATISAYTASGASTCLVKVTEGAAPITILTATASIYTGCQYAVPVTGAEGASWKSSNTGVAAVDQNGVVTAKSTGTAIITASNAGSSGSITIRVSLGYAPGISASDISISAGQSLYLTSSYYVNWYSSNSNIATVRNGIVETKSPGYVTISAYTGYGASTCLLRVGEPDSIRFVYASPNSAPKNATVTFKAITDKLRTAVRFVVSNGSTSYTVNATSKVTDGNGYIWSGSRALGISGVWTVKAYAKTASSDYATTPENGEGEVFVSTAGNTTTAVTGERRASDEVIKMIAEFEGFLPTVTGDSITGDLTIGHGKVVWANDKFYNNLTRNEAYAYLVQTTNKGTYTSVTNEFLVSNNAKFNQRHFDALVCFAYNLGPYALTSDYSLRSTLLSGSSGGTVKSGGSGTINTSGVNLRAGAGTGYAIVTTLNYNTPFTYVDGKLYSSEWYKIRLTDGTTGYVHRDYATPFGGGANLSNTSQYSFTQQLLQYHHAAGSCYYGLLWRRVDEVEIFFYGDYVVDGDRNKYGIYYRCYNDSSFGIG